MHPPPQHIVKTHKNQNDASKYFRFLLDSFHTHQIQYQSTELTTEFH